MSMQVIPLQMVCEMAKSLPAAPWLIPKLVKLLENENARAEDVEELILKDPGLAGATLRMANSAFFASDQTCDSLQMAILRLGFAGIYKMAAGSIASRWLSNDVKGGYGWEPGDLARHSVCVAVCSELLAKRTEKVNEELAYTAGLLHDVGKMALAYACAEHFETIRQYREQSGCSWRQAEHDLLGYDHCDIGGALLASWSCPIVLEQVALYYSRPQLAGNESKDLVVHVHASKHLALQIGMGVGEEGYKTELDETTLEEHGYTEEMFFEILPDAVMESERMVEGIELNKKKEF